LVIIFAHHPTTHILTQTKIYGGITAKDYPNPSSDEYRKPIENMEITKLQDEMSHIEYCKAPLNTEGDLDFQ
jgi:hypothetical protein